MALWPPLKDQGSRKCLSTKPEEKTSHCACIPDSATPVFSSVTSGLGTWSELTVALHSLRLLVMTTAPAGEEGRKLPTTAGAAGTAVQLTYWFLPRWGMSVDCTMEPDIVSSKMITLLSPLSSQTPGR